MKQHCVSEVPHILWANKKWLGSKNFLRHELLPQYSNILFYGTKICKCNFKLHNLWEQIKIRYFYDSRQSE